MMNISSFFNFKLIKTLLAGTVIWLWSAGCYAYDFSVTCYGANNQCGPGTNFTLTKTSTAHDAVGLPFSPTAIQLYLANCTSDTSCTKLVGPFWEKSISYPAWESKTWGNLGTKFLTGSILNGTISAGANGGSSNVWNGNVYKNLCFSITAVNGTTGWGIWGINYTYPAGQVMCSLPVNRVVADTCSLSTPSINVVFDPIERASIGTTAGTAADKTASVTLSCTGTSTHNFSLKMNMTPVSWSTSQIVTSNSALGVSVREEGGSMLNNGDAFSMSVTGSGSTNLIFSLLRNPSVATSAIATGSFTASATLIITEL